MTYAWSRIEQLFYEALALPPEERRAFLDRACEGDLSLRHEVEALLESDSRASGFLSTPIVIPPVAIQSSHDRRSCELTAGTVIGGYRIVRPLGHGGMGEVYEAEDLTLDRHVAIKLLKDYGDSAAAHNRLLKEARAASSLNHAHIVTIHSIERDRDGRDFLVMEYVEGSTLRQRVAASALEIDELLTVATQIADALAAAHARGIVHRDLKPENVMFTASRQVKLLDFGIAANLRMETGRTTEPHSIIGSLSYMSPEQAAGERMDFRSDQFSLGSILYEAATGVRPFDRSTPLETLAAVLRADALPLSERCPRMPEPLRGVIERCLAQNPADRYATTAELHRELALLGTRLFDARQTHEVPAHAGIEPATLSGSSSASNDELNETAAKRPLAIAERREDIARWANRPRRKRIVVALAALVLASATVWLAQRGDRSSPPLTDQESAVPVSLAVLPLTSGSDQTDELLAAGIADSITTRLSNVKQFRVRPTSAVAQYRGKAIDVQHVGRNLRSQYVLVGTIRTTAERVRVSVQLVNASNGSPVWGNQYDLARGDLLSVEDAVASEIATALRLQISDAERERFYRRYTRSGAAYERYLMGRALLHSVTAQDTRRAIAEFEAARDLDPTFAPAYAGLATAAAQLRVRFASARDGRMWDVRARQEAGRALQLDPDLAEAHVALAAVHRFQEFDWDTVIREGRRALELNPSLDDAHLYLAIAYYHIGLLDEAESEVKAALELNPEHRVQGQEILGAVSLFEGRMADAVGHLSQAHEVSDSRIVTYYLGWTLYYQREPQRAEAMLETIIGEEGLVPGNARATLAAIRAARGATSDARALAERVASEQDLLHHAAYGLGIAYAQLRDPTTALRWLSQAATTGFPCYPWYQRDPLLDPIRNDSRFTVFMRELRRSWEDTRARYENRSANE